MKIQLLLAFSLMILGVSADWSWVGRTGNITIPAGTTATVADADVATVSALTGICIEAGGRLSFANTSVRCDLSAALSGAGGLDTGDGAQVTFSGDNRAYTGEMRFDRSKIVVTSRYGLGSATTATGDRRWVYSDGSYHNSARPNADGLRFRGEGLTCDANIRWFGTRDDNGTRTWFTDAMTDKMTFNGRLEMNKMGNVDWIRVGDWTFNGGLGVVNGNQGTPMYRIASGRKAYVNNQSFSQNLSSYQMILMEANAELHLSAGAETGAWSPHNIFTGSGRLVCEAENVLPNTQPCGMGGSGEKTATIDLNGFNQTLPGFCHPTHDKYKWTPAKGEGKYVSIVSALPATATMTADRNFPAFAARFSGAVSLVKAGGGEFVLVSEYSDTTGTNVVNAGEMRYAWGAGWGGDLEIGEAGRIVFCEGSSLNRDGKSRITIADGGLLVVSNGVTLCCESLNWRGEPVSMGEWDAAHCDWLEGEGKVQVRGTDTPHVWTGAGVGWSDDANWGPGGQPVAGAAVRVPAGLTLYVGDADVVAAERVGAIVLEKNARLSFTNFTTRCTLTARLVGDGEVLTGDGAPVTFAGDNRLLAGDMTFDRSCIWVTSRYGLGAATRPDGTVRYAHSNGSYHPTARPNAEGIRFFGEGLVCDAGFGWFGDRAGSQKKAGWNNYLVDSLADELVFNGPFEMTQTGNMDWVMVGNWSFNGGIACRGTTSFTVGENCRAYVRNFPIVDYKTASHSIQVKAGSEFHIACGGHTWSSQRFFYGAGKFVCDAVDVLGARFSLGTGRESGGKAGTLDLNGFDQHLDDIRHNIYNGGGNYDYRWIPVRGEAAHVTVTSSVPATLTMEGAATLTVAMRYMGQAALTKNGAGEYTFVNQFSDTTGTLSVTNGSVVFTWGAGWGGSLSVSGVGSVAFAEPCAHNSISVPAGDVMLADDGKLVVSNGVTFCCRSLTVDGVSKHGGWYTAQSLPGVIEGAGRVRVGFPGLCVSFR